MKPIIFEIGFLHVYGYGLMLVFGFLSGIYLGRWRARKIGENPDHIIQCGLLALLGGIIGSRGAYIIQHWDQFAGASNPLLEMVNITSGGLIYYGGVIVGGATLLGYLMVKRLPVRRFMDILVISGMLGLAFGRAGCLLNGCCYGAPVDEHFRLAQRFPMYSKPFLKLPGSGNPYAKATQSPSPAYEHQFDLKQVRPDERLVVLEPTVEFPLGVPLRPTPPRYLHGKLELDQLSVLTDEPCWAPLFGLLSGGDGKVSAKEWANGLGSPKGLLRGSENWDQAILFDSNRDGQLSRAETSDYFRFVLSRMLSKFDSDRDGKLAGTDYARANEYLQADLFALVADSRSRPVVPAQALGIVNALLITGILSVVYRLRRREGQVTAVMLIAYPVVRFLEESVRGDNVHDLASGVLTHNQITSIVLLALGVVLMISLRWMPPSCCSPKSGRVLRDSRPGGKVS